MNDTNSKKRFKSDFAKKISDILYRRHDEDEERPLAETGEMGERNAEVMVFDPNRQPQQKFRIVGFDGVDPRSWCCLTHGGLIYWGKLKNKQTSRINSNEYIQPISYFQFQMPEGGSMVKCVMDIINQQAVPCAEKKKNITTTVEIEEVD